MSNTSRIIQIPVLFDMSGSSLVFGEEATGDFVDSHLQFLLDMTTEANGISLNASDISSSILVGDQDSGDNLFWDGDANGIGVDNLCNRIAKAITRGKLVHIPTIGNYSNSGIPIGGEGHLYSLHGDKMPAGGYSKKYTASIAPIGDEQMLGQAMARVASVHLIGDPLGSQAFEDAASIQTSLEVASGQTFNQGNTAFYNALAVQLSKVLGGSKSSAPMKPGIQIGSDPVATPYDVTSQTSSITGQTYSSSSEQHVDHASYGDDVAFSGISSGDSKYWLGATGTYNTGDGTYAGSTILNGVFGANSNSWSGQWLQIDLGQTVVLSTYKIWSRRHASTYHAAPREGYLLSSLDGINWFEVHHLTLDDTTGRLLYYNAGTYGSADADITGASNREGRYFAFVMVKAFTNCYAHANIGQLELLGVTKAEFDGGSPPAAYDVATVSSPLHSTTDNRVMSSSSRYDASFPASNAFVAGGSSSFMWASSSLNTTTGEWAANHDHHVFASGVKGEWLGVDVGQNVYVTKFLVDGRHHTHAGYRYHNPREFTLYGSKDNVTYYPLKSYSSPSDGSEYYTTTTGYKPLFIDIDSANPPTDEQDNRIARYFKLSIKSVMGGTQPLIKQFTIFGMKYPTDFGTAAAVTTTIYEPQVTPYDVVSSNSSLTDAANHRYTASSMQHPGHATHDVSVMFDGGGTETSKYWLSNTNAYNTINQDGSYQGYHYTGDLSGEWVQVDLSENVLGSYYTLAGYNNSSYYHYNVKKGYLLSSLDGKKWNLAHTLNVENETDWYEAGNGGYSVQRHVIPNSDARKGKYWRFVFNSNFGRTTNGVAGELMVYGVKYPSQVTEGNGALTTNSVLNYTLNVTPYDCTSVTSPLSGQSYSVSSEATVDHHLRLFDNVVGDLYWHNSGTRYNNAGDISGSYYGPHVTEGYAGEWVQVDVGRVITARNCIMSPRQHTAYTYYAPHSGVLLSSLDGLKWNLVTEWTNGVEATKGETWYNNSAWHVVNVPLSGTYSTARYFRMVFTKSSDHTGIYLCDFKILGVKHPEEVTQGEDTITTSNVPSYVPTVTPYELAGNDSILTDAANHRYTASSMYYPGHASHDVSVMFNNATGPASHYWVSQANYNNSGTNGFDGTYKGTHYTGDLSGDWFQIDLSENVYVTKAVALPYMHTAYFTYGFRKGYLLSSLDGLKWNLIHTYDEPTDDATSIYSNGTWHPYVMNITSSKNCIGRYFRFIVNKTFGATTTAYVAKFRLYGVRYPSQVTEGDGAINTTTLITYTPTVTPYEVHYLPDASHHRLSESENTHPGHTTHGVQIVFDDTPDANNWLPSGNNRYSTTTGKYQGATFTNDVSGEWVQIDLSENILVDRYQYHPYRHTAYISWQVKKGSLLSSLDGLKWELVDTFQNTDTDGSFYYNNSTWHYKDRKVSGKNTIGRYFRFIVQEGYTISAPRIGQIRIFGTRYPSETSQGNIVVDISNNKPGYILTVTPFDLTSPDSILTDAANTRYTASSYLYPGNASYTANRAFDWLSNANTAYYWVPETGTYSSTGFYQHGRTTEDSSGEWIQVDLSENVFVDNYSFIGRLHNAYVNYSVAAGTLFSSLNGTLWKEVHTFDISGTGTETYYNNNMWSAQHFNITQSENCIGRYFRFVINKSFSAYLNITNLTINGVKYPSQVTTQNILLEPALEKTIFWSTDQSASFDVASSNSTLNGQTYTTSSHHYPGNASYEVAQAFNGTLSSASAGWIPRNGQYNSDGTYYGHSKTGIYTGEWIQVDIGQNVNITNYKIHPFSHTAYHTRNVRKTHLLSSLDGLKWNLVHTHNDTATASPYGFPSLTSPISHDLTASYTTGRYFRFVIEETHGNNYPMLSELEINGTLPNVTTNGSSFSTADRYNTFSVQNNVVPYDIYGSSLGHTVPPYIISSKNTNTTSIDIVSTASTINGQTYSASILNANASKVFDNSNVTIFDTSGNPKYNQIDALATNEPNFDSVALATVGAETFLDYTFTEDLTSTSDPSATDITLTTLTGTNVSFQALSITAGKLRLQPVLTVQYNTNVAEYDLTSTSSPLYGTRGDITFSSEYNHGSHDWEHAFNDTLDGPALFASGSWSGRNPVGGVNVVISGVTYHGHWVQLDVGQNVLVKTFEYTPRNAYQSNEWDTLLIAGSKDGTTWDLLWRETERVQSTAQVKETYAVDALDVYSQFRWLCEKTTGSAAYAFNALEITLLGQTEAESIPAPVPSASNFVLQYNKSNTAAVNLVGATNSVALNSFVVGNGAVLSRGGDNFSIYNGATSTTYNTNKTYTGEYVQVDIGSSHFIHNYEIVVPNVNTWDNPKNWILLGSTNNSDWTKLDEATDYTFTSTTTGSIQTALEVRYIRLIINKTSGAYGSFKIASLNINGATLSTNITGQTYSGSVNGNDVPTVFNNNMTSNWVTGFDYNTKTALATNEPEFSSVGVHTDASGNGQLQLTFNANVSSTNINSSNFSVTSLDLSKSEIVVADISDGKIMLEKLAEITGSIFYEDFDDQNFLGEVTTADIVAGGRDGTGHCIQGHDVDPSTKYWKKIITYRAISFWHHFTNTNYNGRIWSAHFDDNDTANSALNLHHYWTHYRYAGGSQAGGGKWTKFYIDGVARTPYAHNTDITNGWHHLYLEFNVDVLQATFLAGSGSNAGRYGSADKIDEVRFFSQGIPESQIIEMANGWNGTYPGATFLNTNYRINYIKDADSSRHVVKEQAGIWSETTVGDGTNNWYGVAMSTDGTKATIVGHNDNVWTSTDSGATFTQRTVTGSWNNVAMSSDGTKQLIASYDAEMKKSLDSGATWTSTLSGGGNWKDITMNQDGTKIYAIVYGGTIFKSTDLDNWPNAYGEFKNWHAITTNGDGSIVAAVPFGDEMVLSTDSGSNWSTMGPGSKDWTDIAMSDDGTKMVAVVFDGHIYNSTDSGANWTQRGVNKIWRSVTMSSDGTKAFATAHGDYVYTSTDSGATWTADTTASGAGASAAKNWKGTATSSNGNITIAVVDSENVWKFGPPPGIPINNFIIHDGTLISRGTGYGEYSASTSTTHNTNQTSTGEYVEVNIGEATLINSYTLHVKTPYTSYPDDNPNPKSWTLLGKTDGGDWTNIHQVTDYTWSTASDYTGGFQVTYYSSSIIQMVAQHYRLIINKTQSKNGYATAAELLINGVKHTSETVGISIVKSASLGTAANAFDKTITNSWDSSSSATYGTLASTVTNEPIFSSGTINGSSQIELTFNTNIDISGTFNKTNLAVTNSSFAPQAYVASVDAGKLLLSYNAEQFPGLDTIFIETFDDQTTTDPLGAVGSIVAGGKDGLGYALKRTTTQTAAGGVVFEQTTIPENIKSMSFWAIVDETDTSTSWHNLLWMRGSSGGGWDTYILRFKDNALGQGTAEQKHMVEKYYLDGVLCGGATLSTGYDSDITEGGNPVTEDSFKGTWRHIYLEWQLPINDPNVTNSFVSKIFWMSNAAGGYAREGRIDDIRFYGQALTETQITTLATNNLVGTFSGSLTDYNFQYTKSNDGNLVNATHTDVGVNSFTLINGTITNRGDDGKGEYTGSTSTTYNTDKTYTGEYVQVDMGQNILMTKYYLHVPLIAPTNPKNWKLLCSSNGTDWTEVHDISNNTSWENSSYISTSSYGSGKQFEGSSAIHPFVGRYFRLVVNKITGSSNHVKIGELQIQGVMHTMETASDNNPIPVAATATPSDNTTTVTDSTVTSTTHLTNDTTTTTSTETRIVVAANTETTTTSKTNVGVVTTATPHFGLTATASNTVTTHSDNTVTSTTYANNDTTTRTLVTKTVDISANTNTSTNYNTVITKIIQAFAVSTGSSSAFNPNKMYDASGVACPALKSIYEQLMNIPGRSQIMESQDFSTSPMPSVETITGGFPFIAGDKLVMYIRPKIQFAQATFPEQFTSLIGFGGKSLGSPAVDIALASGSGGGVSGQTYTKSSEFSGTYAVSKLFDGNTGSIWITASDTFNSGTQVADTNAVGHPIVATTGGDTSDMASQIYHEDFEDQSYDGNVTGAPVVSVTGHTGQSTYVVETKISATERWSQTGYDTVKTFSFWHKYIAGGKTSGTYIFEKVINGGYTAIYWKESDSNFNFEGYNTANSTFYLNGVPKTSGNIPHDATQWTHYCFTFDDTNAGSINWGHPGRGYEAQTQYHTNGYFDDVRFFNEKLTATQIWDLAAGGNGNDGKTYETYNGHYAQIEFTESMAVEKLKLTPRNGGGGGAGEPVDFRLLVLEDDNNPTWTDVLHVSSSQIQPNWNKNGNDWATHEWSIPLSIGQGKYWRLVINKISTGNKVQLAKMELMGGLTSELTGGGDQASALSIPGLETNVTNQATTFPVLFPGNVTGGNEAEAQKYGWVGSANADSLSLETTDETDTRTMDLHIWKITITL